MFFTIIAYLQYLDEKAKNCSNIISQKWCEPTEQKKTNSGFGIR